MYLDGDRGGDLILKELRSVCEIDFVARAPRGKEVEELTKKLLFKSLREKAPANQAQTKTKRKETKREERPARRRKPKIEAGKVEKYKAVIEDLVGTRAACFLDTNNKILGRVPVKEMFSAMKGLNAEALIFDGDIDQKLVNQCSDKGIKYIVGMKVCRLRNFGAVTILTLQDLK